MKTTVTVLAVMMMALTGCASEDPEGEGAEVVSSPPAAATTEAPSETPPSEEPSEPEEAATGTRDNPLELGTTAQVGAWQVTVTEVNHDASEQITAENQFNDPPPEGRQFVMAHLTATYTGEGSASWWPNMSMLFVGSEGNTFGQSMDDDCGVIPQPINDTGETFTDGTIEGNHCWAVPSGQIDGGVIFVEPTLEEGRTFWAVS